MTALSQISSAEIIVIDDSSEDNTVRILQKYTEVKVIVKRKSMYASPITCRVKCKIKNRRGDKGDQKTTG